MNANFNSQARFDAGSQLETIADFRDLPLAELAKTKLESEGIPCFLQDKNLVGIDWMYSFAIGGVKLQVPEEHAGIAKQILNEDCSAELAMVEEEFPAIEKSDLCEKCHSGNLTILDATRKAGAWSLLLGFPFIFFRKRYQCIDCGHLMKRGK